ncbi:redoxin domain-containing protein [Flavobacterium microcysteis]
MQKTGYHQFKAAKKTYLLVSFIFLFTTVANAQLKYTIQGNGKQLKNGDVLYLVYEKNGKPAMDSAKVHKKKFSFSGQIDKPVKASLYRNENPMKANIVAEYLALYLEEGAIKISSPDTLTNASIGGTPLNETMELYRLKLVPWSKKNRAIKDPELFTDTEKKDTALVNSTNTKLRQLFYERTELELEFIKENPASYVSLEILRRISGQSRFVDKIEAAYKQLDKNLKTTPQAAFIEENIVKSRMVAVGSLAKDFIITDMNGNEVRLSSFKGSYVLLDFWASWCGPCRKEHPNLATAYAKFKEKGFTILSVSIDTNKDKWLKAVANDRLSWTQVSDLKGNNSESYLLYGVTTIPANFLINPKGTIIAKDLKGDSLQEELAKVFADK